MSYYEGSNWQARKQDEGKPLFDINDKKFDPINLSKEDLIKAVKTSIQSEKEKEKYCQRLEKALSICHDLLRDIDIYEEYDDLRRTLKECSDIATNGLTKLYKEYPDLFLLEAEQKTNTNEPKDEQ